MISTVPPIAPNPRAIPPEPRRCDDRPNRSGPLSKRPAVEPKSPASATKFASLENRRTWLSPQETAKKPPIFASKPAHSSSASRKSNPNPDLSVRGNSHRPPGIPIPAVSPPIRLRTVTPGLYPMTNGWECCLAAWPKILPSFKASFSNSSECTTNSTFSPEKIPPTDRNHKNKPNADLPLGSRSEGIRQGNGNWKCRSLHGSNRQGHGFESSTSMRSRNGLHEWEQFGSVSGRLDFVRIDHIPFEKDCV